MMRHMARSPIQDIDTPARISKEVVTFWVMARGYRRIAPTPAWDARETQMTHCDYGLGTEVPS